MPPGCSCGNRRVPERVQRMSFSFALMPRPRITSVNGCQHSFCFAVALTTESSLPSAGDFTATVTTRSSSGRWNSPYCATFQDGAARLVGNSCGLVSRVSVIVALFWLSACAEWSVVSPTAPSQLPIDRVDSLAIVCPKRSARRGS